MNQHQSEFLARRGFWVFFPEKVVFEISENGVDFQKIHEERIEVVPDGKKAIRTVRATLVVAPPVVAAKNPIRYVRVTATNIKTCPAWHPCNGNPCWIFADEIIVR